MRKEYSEKERAWLWINDVLGANVSSTDQLIYCNDGILELFEAVKLHRQVKYPKSVSAAQKADLIKKCSDFYVDSLIESMERKGIYALARESEGYPELLREIYDPPGVIYVKGFLPRKIKLPIAVIGSRNCSDYGRSMAGYFGRELASHGACVVSGLAAGCDSEASKGALMAVTDDIPTVAVLGSGVDVVYPASSKELYDRIVERGAVISEFKPGKRPTRDSFPQRNRIISGLSKGVLVVEAGARSGTRLTVDFAHDQGRDVFAVPGRISDLKSVGTNGMIKSGEAKAVFGVDDILYEYGIFIGEASSPVAEIDVSKLDPEHRRICEVLLLGEKTADALCESTGFSASDINMYLTELELSGIIKQLPNGEYAVK